MPLFKCSECHHEWETTKQKDTCAWCKAEGYIIDDTEMERVDWKQLMNGWGKKQGDIIHVSRFNEP